MLKCSHILWKARELKQAVDQFTGAGFNTSWGSKPDRVYNAFVWFEEGPFIEIISMPRYVKALLPLLRICKGAPTVNRWKKWFYAQQGWCDIAIEPVDPEHAFDLTEIRKALLAKGIGVSKIIKGQRVRPDGLKVQYSYMGTEPSSLPFVVSLYDTPQRPSSVIHPNGAQSIDTVTLSLSESERVLFEKLCRKDSWIRPVEGTNTRIAVTINGFSGNIWAGDKM